jgi:hypothetical protein
MCLLNITRLSNLLYLCFREEASALGPQGQALTADWNLQNESELPILGRTPR